MKTEKPFIKLLKSPNSGYFFDVNRNEIIAVSDEAYEFLEKEQQGTDCDATAEVSAELEALRENGYLSGNKVKEIRHPLTDYIDDITLRSMNGITLQITQGCNFACSYCPYVQTAHLQRTHSSKKMSWETAKKSLLFLREHSVDSEKVSIGFYGGEPLLEFELMKKCVLFAEEIFEGREYLFTTTTNASLLNGEIIEFFIEHNFSLVVSLDGPKDIHDKNRVYSNKKGTFADVEKKLLHIYENYPDFFKKLLVNMVLDPANDFDEINKIYSSHKIYGELNFQSSMLDDRMCNEKNFYNEDYTAKYEYHDFLALLNAVKRFPKEGVSPIAVEGMTGTWSKIDKMVSKNAVSEKSAPAGPCVPGKQRLMVTVDGSFMPCERVSETSPIMRIGDIDNGFDMVNVEKLLNVATLTANECKNCWAFSQCGACGGFADDGTDYSRELKLARCMSFKNTFFNLICKIIFLRESHKFYLRRDGDSIEE